MRTTHFRVTDKLHSEQWNFKDIQQFFPHSTFWNGAQRPVFRKDLRSIRSKVSQHKDSVFFPCALGPQPQTVCHMMIRAQVHPTHWIRTQLGSWYSLDFIVQGVFSILFFHVEGTFTPGQVGGMSTHTWQQNLDLWFSFQLRVRSKASRTFPQCSHSNAKPSCSAGQQQLPNKRPVCVEKSRPQVHGSTSGIKPASMFLSSNLIRLRVSNVKPEKHCCWLLILVWAVLFCTFIKSTL